jgi:xylulose-5-phosphate/fructose-6-phosphate phosphoketolase
MAAASILRESLPELKVPDLVNVIDLSRLRDESEHPHSSRSRSSTAIFTPISPWCSPITAIRR